MGTDIHAFVETKHNNWVEWEAELNLDRNYGMFALLAGVRGNEDVLFDPRGIPDDANMVTVGEYRRMGSDAHTPSWLTTDEFAAVLDEYTARFGAPNPVYVAALAFMRALGDGTRIVFWFDN